jgi:hypothetical protein
MEGEDDSASTALAESLFGRVGGVVGCFVMATAAAGDDVLLLVMPVRSAVLVAGGKSGATRPSVFAVSVPPAVPHSKTNVLCCAFKKAGMVIIDGI